MPMVVNKNQRIFFRFEGDRGAFLLLHHGLLGSHRDWFDAGYVDELASQFRLIIPDARGHGRSDHSINPEDYDVANFADDLIAVMDSLDIRNTHFLGVSLGAQVGFDMLRRYPDRLRVTLLGGEVPFATEAAREAWRGYAKQVRERPWAEAVAHIRGEAPYAGSEAQPPGASIDAASSVAAPVPEHTAEPVRLDSTPTGESTDQTPSAIWGFPPSGVPTDAAALALLEAMANWPVFQDDRTSVESPLVFFDGAKDPAHERLEAAVARVARARLITLGNTTTPELFRQREPVLEILYRYIRTGKRPQDGGQPGEAVPANGDSGGRGRGNRGTRGRGRDRQQPQQSLPSDSAAHQPDQAATAAQESQDSVADGPEESNAPEQNLSDPPVSQELTGGAAIPGQAENSSSPSSMDHEAADVSGDPKEERDSAGMGEPTDTTTLADPWNARSGDLPPAEEKDSAANGSTEEPAQTTESPDSIILENRKPENETKSGESAHGTDNPGADTPQRGAENGPPHDNDD